MCVCSLFSSSLLGVLSPSLVPLANDSDLDADGVALCQAGIPAD